MGVVNEPDMPEPRILGGTLTVIASCNVILAPLILRASITPVRKILIARVLLSLLCGLSGVVYEITVSKDGDKGATVGLE